MLEPVGFCPGCAAAFWHRAYGCAGVTGGWQRDLVSELKRSKKTNGTEEQQEEWNRDYSEVRGVPHLMPGVASVLPFIHRDGCINIVGVCLAKAASEGGFKGRA